MVTAPSCQLLNQNAGTTSAGFNPERFGLKREDPPD